MSKEQLQGRVLDDPRIQIYECGARTSRRPDRPPRAGHAGVPRQLGPQPTVSGLKCGHSDLTTSGNVSEHGVGQRGRHRGRSTARRSSVTRARASITDTHDSAAPGLQGVDPHQIISLMTPADFGGADNILILPDHYDHIHVGFHPLDRRRAARKRPERPPVASTDGSARRHRQPDGADAPVAPTTTAGD